MGFLDGVAIHQALYHQKIVDLAISSQNPHASCDLALDSVGGADRGNAVRPNNAMRYCLCLFSFKTIFWFRSSETVSSSVILSY